MIQLEKQYQKEAIPGLRQQVGRAIERSLMQSLDAAKSNHERTQQLLAIQQKCPDLTNEEVYDLCPFRSFLDTFPGLSDWTALHGFQKSLSIHMKEEVNTWAKDIIDHLNKQMFPRRSPFLKD